MDNYYGRIADSFKLGLIYLFIFAIAYLFYQVYLWVTGVFN